MKFKRVKDTYLYPKYVREDGKVTIEPSAAGGFCVYDEKGSTIDKVKRLKDAKEIYENWFVKDPT